MKYQIPAILETGGGENPRERLEALDEEARREIAAHVALERLAALTAAGWRVEHEQDRSPDGR